MTDIQMPVNSGPSGAGWLQMVPVEQRAGQVPDRLRNSPERTAKAIAAYHAAVRETAAARQRIQECEQELKNALDADVAAYAAARLHGKPRPSRKAMRDAEQALADARQDLAGEERHVEQRFAALANARLTDRAAYQAAADADRAQVNERAQHALDALEACLLDLAEIDAVSDFYASPETHYSPGIGLARAIAGESVELRLQHFRQLFTGEASA